MLPRPLRYFTRIANDFLGNSALYSIHGVGAAPVYSMALGVGFYGGLAWDSTTSSFYAIASESFGVSTLYRFSLGGSGPAALFDLGRDETYMYSSLTVAQEPVPEPGRWLAVVAGLVGLAVRRIRRENSNW